MKYDVALVLKYQCVLFRLAEFVFIMNSWTGYQRILQSHDGSGHTFESSQLLGIKSLTKKFFCFYEQLQHLTIYFIFKLFFETKSRVT